MFPIQRFLSFPCCLCSHHKCCVHEQIILKAFKAAKVVYNKQRLDKKMEPFCSMQHKYKHDIFLRCYNNSTKFCLLTIANTRANLYAHFFYRFNVVQGKVDVYETAVYRTACNGSNQL